MRSYVKEITIVWGDQAARGWLIANETRFGGSGSDPSQVIDVESRHSANIGCRAMNELVLL
jgi:hypothetical protein